MDSIRSLAQILQAAKSRNLARAQLLRQRKFGARHEPVREVIALGVISELSSGTVRNSCLELVQV